MGAIGTPEYVRDAAGTEAEREELDWLLTSGVLGRSGNLARVLTYICEERFAGRSHQIKEYTIATEALGRRPDFNPHTDTIVRVTVHSLRKRLVEVYQNEGADRPTRLVLPPGHYDPLFVHAPQAERAQAFVAEAPLAASVARGRETVEAPDLPRDRTWRPPTWWLGTIAVCLAIAGAGVWMMRHPQVVRWHPLEFGGSGAPLPPLPSPQAKIHALMGNRRRPYVDRSGDTWATGNYCQGGTNVTVPSQKIEGTEDAPLYLGGVRGIAHCVFPVTGSLYELHFYFAETSDLAAATRVGTLSVNAGPAMRVDVVDDAGGDGIATSTVVTGVAPERDGSIHVDFTSDVSPLNAVEILPAPSASLLPVRIVAGSKSYLDSAHQLWASDRYFSGGRHGMPPKVAGGTDAALYGADRIGRFRYSIPAVPMAHYRVRLYFREPWFGKENRGTGGPGSRVFDVSCNGELLLKNFDILAEDGAAPVVKTFEHVQASAGGHIELYFMPVVNYAMVNAIEILPED